MLQTNFHKNEITRKCTQKCDGNPAESALKFFLPKIRVFVGDWDSILEESRYFYSIWQLRFNLAVNVKTSQLVVSILASYDCCMLFPEAQVTKVIFLL